MQILLKLFLQSSRQIESKKLFHSNLFKLNLFSKLTFLSKCYLKNYLEYSFNLNKIFFCSKSNLINKENYLNQDFNSEEIDLTHRSDNLNLRSKKIRKNYNNMSLEKPGMPKWHLKNIFYLLRNHSDVDEDNKLKFKNPKTFCPEVIFMKRAEFWQCEITLYHPTKQQFRELDKKKLDAEDKASYKAILWLRKQGIINYDNKPIVLQKMKLKKIHDVKKGISEPLKVKELNSAQKRLMLDFIEAFDLRHKNMLENDIDMSLLNKKENVELYFQNCDYVNDFFTGNINNDTLKNQEICNVISGRLLHKLSANKRDRINAQLIHFLRSRDDNKSDSFLEYKNRLKNLPISSYKEEILDLIYYNQVVIISGETGCGKTTQIPQYILEDMIQANCGADCSILVTQPRRLPAISIAEQCAIQFGEQFVGSSFGYQVRFEKELPIRDNGVVLFCTTGVLLRKMANNPYLLGVSHLIIDEVHERQFLEDILFVLLKQVLEKNDRIKIILMSASLNPELFSKFFKNCPIYHVHGRCFPVEKVYLDQIERMLQTSCKKVLKLTQPKIDAKLICELIHYINNTRDDNFSILCFLPGWNDIKQVEDLLNETRMKRMDRANSMLVIPVHSKLNANQQKLIFKPLVDGERKIILSTNIAETSITVPDVVYVIDPGLCNEVFYHKEYNVSTFGTHWISQANVKQREGRSGRIRPGICYKLYTEQLEKTHMLKYFVPEMLRIPLESVVMFSKLYCPQESAVEFLSKTLEPPSSDAIAAAVQTLKLINVLDKNERLTLLGKKITSFTTHPRLSVCLVTGSMLGCLEAITNLSAILSTPKDPFNVVMGDKNLIKTIKEELSEGYLSDYFALYKLLNYCDSDGADFTRNYLSRQALDQAKYLKDFYERDMEENNLTHIDLNFQEFKSSNCFFDLSLLSGLYPNILKYVNEKNNKKFYLIDVNTGTQALYTGESVLSSAKIENEDYFTSIYFDSYFSEERNRLMVKNASIIPSIYLLLVCKNINIFKEDEYNVLFNLDNSKFLIFNMNKHDLNLIIKWKEIFYLFQNWFLCYEKDTSSSTYSYLRKIYKQFLDLTNIVFDRYSKKSEINLGKQN